jgi:hypothetical protein
MLKKKKNTNNKLEEKTQKEKEFDSLSSFFDKYISNGKLIVKYATLFDLQRIQYIKGKDFKQFFDENFSDIQKEILEITKNNIGKEANKDSLQKFYIIIQEYNIMHYLKRIPGDKAKYPKKLLPLTKDDDKNLDLIFSETGFYTLQIKVEKSNKPLIYLVLLIILILFIVLFPIWPLNVKLGVLYFLMACLMFLIVFLILTIIISLVGVLFGYDILIIPNIDEPKMGWKDRLFNPFVAINKREDPCWFVVIRIILLILLIALCILGIFFPRIPKASWRIMKNFTEYAFDYGKQKIEDIHYHRNDMTLRDSNQYLEDLDNI